MREKFQTKWKGIPDSIRKPIVLTIGMFFVIASGLLGWLPGPGGIPLFLIGVAILATEYSWAQRLKVFVLKIVSTSGQWLRQHPVIMTIAMTAIVLTLSLSVYLMYLVITTR